MFFFGQGKTSKDNDVKLIVLYCSIVMFALWLTTVTIFVSSYPQGKNNLVMGESHFRLRIAGPKHYRGGSSSSNHIIHDFKS